MRLTNWARTSALTIADTVATFWPAVPGSIPAWRA